MVMFSVWCSGYTRFNIWSRTMIMLQVRIRLLRFRFVAHRYQNNKDFCLIALKDNKNILKIEN